MSNGKTLTNTVLDAFAAALERSGSPLLTTLQPGMDVSRQEETVRDLGIELSPEARLWWSWHNGADLDSAHPELGNVTFLSLERAVEEAKMMKEISSATAAAGYDPWNPTWLPLLGTDGASITCDCAARSGPSAVRYIDFELGPESFEPVLPSIGELVAFWTETLDRELVTYDRSTATWQYGESFGNLDDDLQVLI